MKIRELVYLQATLGLETREALEVLALKFAMAALPMVTLLTLLSTRSRSLRSGLPEPSQRTLPPKFIRRACPAVKARAGPAASVSLDEGRAHDGWRPTPLGTASTVPRDAVRGAGQRTRVASRGAVSRSGSDRRNALGLGSGCGGARHGREALMALGRMQSRAELGGIDSSGRLRIGSRGGGTGCRRRGLLRGFVLI